MFCDTDLQLMEACQLQSAHSTGASHNKNEQSPSGTAIALIRNDGKTDPAEPLEVLPLGFAANPDDNHACNIHALVSASANATTTLATIGPQAPEDEIIRVRFADSSDQAEHSVIILELPATYQAQWRSQHPTSVDALIARLVARGRLFFECLSSSNTVPISLFNAFVNQAPSIIFSAVTHIALDTGSGKDVSYQSLLSLCAKARTIPRLSTVDICLYGEPSACSRFAWPDLTPSMWVYEGATYDDWDAESEVKSYLPSKQELTSVYTFLKAEHSERVADHLLDATREALRSFHWDRIKITNMQSPNHGPLRLTGGTKRLAIGQ